MQTMTARDAQTKFGNFSREAQRDTVVVTNHGQPVFLTIPVKMTANVARMIREASPKDNHEASASLGNFFTELSRIQTNTPVLSESEINALIKSS